MGISHFAWDKTFLQSSIPSENILIHFISDVNTEAATGGVCSMEKGVYKNCATFTGKDLCQGLFVNKVEISNNTCFTEHLWTTASRYW